MRKLLVTAAGLWAATAVLWAAGTVGRVDSMMVGAATVVGVLAGRAASIGLGRLAAAHREINDTQADAMAGAPIMYWHTGQRRDQATDAQVQP